MKYTINKFKVGDTVKIVNNNKDDVVHNWDSIGKIEIPFIIGKQTIITHISNYRDGRQGFKLNDTYWFPITVFQKQSKNYEIYY